MLWTTDDPTDKETQFKAVHSIVPDSLLRIMRDVMQDIFKIIKDNKQREENKKTISIGIDFQIAGREICCPVSKNCHSYEDLAVEVGEIKRNLECVLVEAKTHFKGPAPKGDSGFEPETSAEETWPILAGIKDESIFVERFNSLDVTKRKEVAEYVLSKCNIFSGRGSVFSTRYNNGTGYME